MHLYVVNGGVYIWWLNDVSPERRRDNKEVRILPCKFINLQRESVVLVRGFEVDPPMG